MLTNIYYSLAIFAYSSFLLQFILSLFGANSDVDLDIDGDGSCDLSWGDIFSFKGIIHFLMGFAGWLSLKSYNNSLEWFDYPIAILCGISFFLIIFLLGRLLLRFKHEPHGATENDFDGCKGVITIVGEDNTYSVMLPEYNGYEITAYSEKQYTLGQEVTIFVTKDKKYYI